MIRIFYTKEIFKIIFKALALSVILNEVKVSLVLLAKKFSGKVPYKQVTTKQNAVNSNRYEN